MRVDAMLSGPVGQVPETAVALEALGVGGIWAAETSTDPFFPLLLAAEHTRRVTIGTGVAIAFARTPMTLAYQIAALHDLAPGRVTIGLGTQVKSHVTRRFGMPWSNPVERMREYVAALRHIWRSWSEGTEPSFRGAIYRHTFMPPFFAPSVGSTADLNLFVAGFGPHMTTMAAEVGDGFMFHPFTTRRYLSTCSLPAVRRGLVTGSRGPATFQIAGTVPVVTGTDEEMALRLTGARAQIAFYASTPIYLPVLALHGIEDLQRDVRRLVFRQRWEDLPRVVDDEILELFAVVAPPEQLAAALVDRFAGVADQVFIPFPESALEDPDRWRAILREVEDRTAGDPPVASTLLTPGS